MAKKYALIAAGAVKLDGRYIAPGAVFEIGPKKEAERLVALGAARLPATEMGGKPAAQAEPDAELLAQIAAAVTLDELAALMPKDKPGPAVVAAFERRGALLENS